MTGFPHVLGSGVVAESIRRYVAKPPHLSSAVVILHNTGIRLGPQGDLVGRSKGYAFDDVDFRVLIALAVIVA
jgi:hypothetical protein